MLTFDENINSVNAPEPILTLIEISHISLTNPARFVNDNVEFTYNSNVFTPLAFRIDMPTQPESGMPEARLKLTNLGSVLMDALLDTQGLVGARCKIRQVMKSDPNNDFFEVDLFLTDIKTTASAIDSRLEYTNIYSSPGFRTLYTIDSAPGLF